MSMGLLVHGQVSPRQITMYRHLSTTLAHGTHPCPRDLKIAWAIINCQVANPFSDFNFHAGTYVIQLSVVTAIKYHLW